MNLKKKKALAYERGLFRYVILEPLLTSPPVPGELALRLREISSKNHIQPWDHRSIVTFPPDPWSVTFIAKSASYAPFLRAY
jgi:hypothetical protein